MKKQLRDKVVRMAKAGKLPRSFDNFSKENNIYLKRIVATELVGNRMKDLATLEAAPRVKNKEYTGTYPNFHDIFEGVDVQ